MALNFPLSYGPVFPVEVEKKPRNNVSAYGDGYEQRSGDGINIIKPETEVVWTSLTKAEMDTVDAFLTARAGQEGFLWTYPGDSAATKWVCDKWKPRFIGPGNYGINASFRRDFNPG